MQIRQTRLCLICSTAILVLFSSSCASTIEYPSVAEVESQVLLTDPNGVSVYNGGYGSSLAVVRGRPGVFYLLTDRGPNIDTANADEKAFLLPTFAPHIGVFQLDGTSLKRVRWIEMKDASGNKLVGLPHLADRGGAIENAVDIHGNVLPRNANGVDPEGLVALEDGTFWIGDEYGPYLLHLDADGKVIERISPFSANSNKRALPRVLTNRRLNYGIEGLTITPDGTTLIAAMQSALDNPDRSVRATTRTTRLVLLNLATGATRQLVYPRERPQFSVTDVTAISANELMVLERDDNFPGDPSQPGRHKRVYRIDMRQATDVSDANDSPSGQLFDGKTLEQLTESEMTSAKINPVVKTLVVDLLTLEGGYPHDKPEGLVLLTDGLLAISNDDDFGIDNDARGTLIQKIDPATGARDRNRIYFIRLAR